MYCKSHSLEVTRPFSVVTEWRPRFYPNSKRRLVYATLQQFQKLTRFLFFSNPNPLPLISEPARCRSLTVHLPLTIQQRGVRAEFLSKFFSAPAGVIKSSRTTVKTMSSQPTHALGTYLSLRNLTIHQTPSRKTPRANSNHEYQTPKKRNRRRPVYGTSEQWGMIYISGIVA